MKRQKKEYHKGHMRSFWISIMLILLSIILLTAFRPFNPPVSEDTTLLYHSPAPESTSPESDQRRIDQEPVTPETWRRIHIEMQKLDGSRVKIDLLRPIWWLEKTGAEVGGTISLNMPEMGIEGEAEVRDIGACEADARSDDPNHRLVTGKFTHENAVVLDLYFDNTLNEPLGVTPNHPLLSITRHAWIEAGRLNIGEHVKTKDGIAQLTKRTQRAGRHKVYNLEVHQNHTFYVSGFEILAHNMCAMPVPKKKPKAKPVNLPSWRKIDVDWNEVLTGHKKDGDRILGGKKGDVFPDTMSEADIKRAVKEAYKNSKKIKTQGNKIKLRGSYNGKTIDMWLDTKNKVLDTAYPQGWGYKSN